MKIGTLIQYKSKYTVDIYITNMTNVSIIIPSLNGKHLLAECLPSLMKQTYLNFDVLVIDNGSTDDTVSWLKPTYPHVRIIENQKNLGFAAAVNQGIRNSNSPYVVTLNNDVVVDADWLESLIETADADSRLGMCASKMVFWHEPSIINSSGISVDRAGIVWDRAGGEVDVPPEDKKRDVFGPCAGAALYRRTMLDEIGLFDEAYFAYFEDVDLAWRARAMGWGCAYVETARACHHHSATSIKGSHFKNTQLGKNKVRLILKNYPFKALWWYIPVLLFYDILAVGYQLLSNKNFDTLRGRWMGWRSAGEALAARPSFAARHDLPHLSAITWPWSVWHRFQHLSDM